MRRRAWQIVVLHTLISLTLVVILVLHISTVVAIPVSRPATSADRPTAETLTEVRQIGRGTTLSVAWNPQQALLAVGGSRGVWLYSPRLVDIGTIDGVLTPAEVIAWSPDGTLLAIGSADVGIYSVQVWDLVSRKVIFTIPQANAYERPVLSWGPNNALGTIDGNKIIVWSPHDQQPMLDIHGDDVQIISATWSPDGNMLATSDINRTINVWSTKTGHKLTSFSQADLPLALAWSPDSTLLASAGSDQISIWDVASGRPSSTLAGFKGIVTRLDWVGGWLASAANDDLVRLWNVGTREVMQTLVGHSGFITDFDFSPDGNQIATASLDNTARIWDIASGAPLQMTGAHTGKARALAWSPDGRILASASAGHAVQFWNPDDGSFMRTLEGHTDDIYTLAWNSTGTQIASAGADGVARVWDSATAQSVAALAGHFGTIQTLTWSPSNDHLASAGYDGLIHIWDVHAEKNTMTLPAQADETIDSLAWSQAGDQIASSGQDGTIALWNPITGDLISRLKGHSGPVRGVVWSADGSKVVSAGDDGSVQIWQNEQHLATIAAHDASIVALAWRPQSGQFASVDCDGWLRVWNIDTQSAEITLPVGPTLALAWSPDGQHLALGGDDSIRIFDVRRKPEARVDGAQAMTIKPYRVIASALAIRAQPRTGDQFRTGQTLKFDELINVDESSRVTADGIVWLHHDRGWSAERTLDGKSVYLLDAALRPKDRQWGINIDPANPFGSPPAARLFGLGWVRFVFHFQSKYSSLDQAYAFYDPIIKAYQNTGTHVLLVLLQDTYRGNSPWSNNQGWDTFAMGFANTALRIASHYKGQVAAYEIWNEGDLPASAQTIQTSIYVPPEQYGPLLVLTSAAIKGGDPAAKVISGGLASSDPTGYLTKVNASINPPGRISLPVDAIAIHPYGRTPPGGAPFVGWSQGSLGDAISRLSDAFPLVPLWITEIGVPRVDVSNQAFWPGIANYMNKTFQLIRNDYFHIVPVVIWFAWADAMDNAGVVTNSQQPKGPIFDAFMTCLHADQVVYARQTATPFDGKIILTHVTGASVTENTVGQLATTINANAANAKAILVRTSIGASWASAFDGKPAMAIGGTNDLAHWAAELARYRIDLHAWHFLRGDGSDAEISLMAQAGTASGVMSLVLDLDPDALQLRSVDDIRTFMIALRAQYKGHLGVSFDGRPERFSSVHLLEWYPFVNSWHPKLFNWQYSNGSQTPDVYFVALTNALKPYPRPIIPIVGAEAVAGRPVPPDQIRGAGALAFATYNLPAVSYWKTGAIGPAEFTAIQSVVIPWFTAMIPVAGSADFVVVQTTSSLRIRSTPDINGAVVGALQPGDRITVRERRVSGAQLWVRHDKGWSLARNGATGEIYLA